MSKSTVALACALGILVMLPISADEAKVKLNADTGLWEVTTHPEMSGTLKIPEEQLQKMTPEQRARVEAALQTATERAKQEHVTRQCVTPEQLGKGFDLGNEGSSCKTTIIRNTSSELEVRRACTEDSNVRTTTEHFRMNGRRHVLGTVDAAMMQGGKPLTMHMTIEGRWLGADCGGIKGAQVVK
ncbi:MAG: DUF3617 domain-containing protein [Steroidobacteraceae bacterium]